MRFDLFNEEWAVIEPFLPKGGRVREDRRVLTVLLQPPSMI
jgi:hypothetical protein